MTQNTPDDSANLKAGASQAPGENPDSPAQPAALPLMIHAQYIKDLSFESPNPLQALRAGQENPDMVIDINLDARKVEHDKIPHFYEVEMALKTEAKRGETTLFIAELLYAGAVSLSDVPESQHHQMLLVQTPHYMFPFARHILSDVVQKGGYPPLLLNPVNFRDMYLQRFGKRQENQEVA